MTRPLTGVRRSRVALLLALTLTVGLLVATQGPEPADARAEPVFTASQAGARKCHLRNAEGRRGVDGFTITAPTTGLLRVRLAPLSNQALGADWDVAVFDRADERLVAASAAPRSYELADGFVEAGDELWVQGCRYGGRAAQVGVSVRFFATPPPGRTPPHLTQVVAVNAAGRAAKQRLAKLGVELTEAATEQTMDVVLHGKSDANRLRAAGFSYTVKIADLAAHVEQVRKADHAFAARNVSSDLPSGRTSYRRLVDYEYEMKNLARRYPGLVKVFTLNHRSIEGRDVSGVEIARNVSRVGDGKPIFLNLGVHHAREWPSGEHAMEWAYDLAGGYGRDARTTGLVGATRNIVVPIVNPDGFSVSREAAPLGDFSLFDYENQRKNCNPADAPAALRTGPCPVNPAGVGRGTDLNRNYGAFWGGAGAAPLWNFSTYRGSAPFSEPETQNIRELVSARQVTNLITNHTYGNLLLRPPGVRATGQPVDEKLLASIGQSMADMNDYANIRGWQLYDTTGTTDDWSYWITGSLSYTFEIGPNEFHPPFADGVIGEYLGRDPADSAGRGGNRAAYFTMLQSTADSAHHATITGRAPRGSTLRVRKQFRTPTSPVLQPDGSQGPPLMVEDELNSTFKAPGGRFRWSVNPSTRPYVAGRYGRLPAGPVQAPINLTNPPGEPGENTGSQFDEPREVIPFTVLGPPAADNGEVRIRIEWTNPENDWDVYIVDEGDHVVSQAASFGSNFEEAGLLDPPPGAYRAIVINYDQLDGQPFDDWTGGISFEPPTPAVPGTTEAWTLTCELAAGATASVQQVTVARGETVDVGRLCRPKQNPRD